LAGHAASANPRDALRSADAARLSFSGVRATQQRFIDCLKSGEEFETSGRDYLKTIRAVQAAYESIEKKKSCPLFIGETKEQSF
jgi:predicted dehydrogenase